MNKEKQFSIKGNYVSPSMKIAAMRTRRSILTVSPDGYLRFGNDPGTVEGLDDNQGYGDI